MSVRDMAAFAVFSVAFIPLAVAFIVAVGMFSAKASIDRKKRETKRKETGCQGTSHSRK